MEQIFSMHVSQNWVLKRGQQKGMFLKAIVFFGISVRCPFSKIQKITWDWNLRQMNMVYTHLYTKNSFNSTWSSKETPWYSFQNNLNSPCFQNFMDVKKFELPWLNKWEGLNKYFVRKQCLKHQLW